MEIIVLKYTCYNKGLEHNSYFTKILGQDFKIYENLEFLKVYQSATVISFDYPNIIDNLVLFEFTTYIDIENLKKQLSGRSKLDFDSKKRPWLIWNMINELNPNDFNLTQNAFERNINNSKAIFLGINSDGITVDEVFSFLLKCIEKIYLNLKDELTLSNEKERFEKIESKLNNVLFNTTKRGININVELVKKHIENINVELYQVKNRLQIEYGIFSLRDYNNIKKNLIREFNWFNEIKINSKEFWKALKLRRNTSTLVDLLYLEKKLTKNKTILTRVGSLDSGSIFPLFDYMGTITSRILVTSPSLQQLQKKYRDIIIPEKDKELIYIDYCQFEAGILAHEANDNKLIAMYNTSDIYTQISNKLGEENVSRDLAKKLFFSYCYGMTKENILKYSGHNLNIFFEEFKSLEAFELKIFENFQKDGYVETIYGNRRYKSLNNTESKKEGWLISQRIQGTASLILKDVILNLYKSQKDIQFLLPMHDAILYQVPNTNVEEYKKIIIETFEIELKKYFKKLIPKASSKKFTE